MKQVSSERCLWLNEDEAMSMLATALVCPGDISPEQYVAIHKLSEFCRQFLREELEGASAVRPSNEIQARGAATFAN